MYHFAPIAIFLFFPMSILYYNVKHATSTVQQFACNFWIRDFNNYKYLGCHGIKEQYNACLFYPQDIKPLVNSTYHTYQWRQRPCVSLIWTYRTILKSLPWNVMPYFLLKIFIFILGYICIAIITQLCIPTQPTVKFRLLLFLKDLSRINFHSLQQFPLWS